MRQQSFWETEEVETLALFLFPETVDGIDKNTVNGKDIQGTIVSGNSPCLLAAWSQKEGVSV